MTGELRGYPCLGCASRSMGYVYFTMYMYGTICGISHWQTSYNPMTPGYIGGIVTCSATDLSRRHGRPQRAAHLSSCAYRLVDYETVPDIQSASERFLLGHIEYRERVGSPPIHRVYTVSSCIRYVGDTPSMSLTGISASELVHRFHPTPPR